MNIYMYIHMYIPVFKTWLPRILLVTCSFYDQYFFFFFFFFKNLYFFKLGGGEDYRESSMYWHFGNRVPSFYKVGLDVMCLMGLKGFRYPQSHVFWDI